MEELWKKQRTHSWFQHAPSLRRWGAHPPPTAWILVGSLRWVGKDSRIFYFIDSPQPRDLQMDQIVNGGLEINLCDEFSVEKPTICGIVDWAPRRDWTCACLWLQAKPPCPWQLFWVVQDTSLAFFLFLFLFRRWAFCLKKEYPLPSAYCVMRVLKRLSPSGEL